MDINSIYEYIDNLYLNNKSEEVCDYILSQIELAVNENNDNVHIQLLNELIGEYRERGIYDKVTAVGNELIYLINKNNLAESIPGATTMLNIATAYRAAGYLNESLVLYNKVKEIYDKYLDKSDFQYAPLYNNMSLLFQEKGDYESACDCLNMAASICLLYPEKYIELATTYVNLGNNLLLLNQIDDAMRILKEATLLFEKDDIKDYHYSGALAALGEIALKKNMLDEAISYFNEAMNEIERTAGKNKGYEIMKHNLEAVMNIKKESMNKEANGLELCRRYYEEFGKSMIHNKFPEYEDKIAVGLVGEGSECFGFDDSTSMDHDFGPGFCMWLDKETYEKIGESLQAEYDKLPDTFEGIKRINTVNAGKRVGVFEIGAFYEKLLGIKGAPSNKTEWMYINDEQFAVATNGEVFKDDKRVFSRIRKQIISHYPVDVYAKKVARECTLISQTGQYNFKRMLDRGDTVTARIALSDFMKHSMQLAYLLNKKYAPYYKWLFKGLDTLDKLSNIKEPISILSKMDILNNQVYELIDEIVRILLNELKAQNLITGDDDYLDHHTNEIINNHSALVEQIVDMEWRAFDIVRNEGGRASCQDDYITFSAMRKSQYMTWPNELLLCYIYDFNEANKTNMNLITEKYGRMMESTAPDRYEEIKNQFKPIPDDKKKIIEAIVAIQVGWMEEFADKYPKAAMEARSIHTSEDNEFNTSYETYLRGEISTYSDETLALYGRFIAQVATRGDNLAFMIMENSALLYGYKSLDDLESKL